MRARRGCCILISMNSSTADELHKRLADHRRLRTMTWDAQALEAIDAIIAETEDRLRRLSRPDRRQTDRPNGGQAQSGTR